MTTKRRVFYKPDGQVSICTPAPGSKRENEIDQEWLDRVFKKAAQNPKYATLPFDDIDATDLPADRSQRDKWRGSQGHGVSIDDSVNTIQERKAADIAALGNRAALIQEINDLANASAPLKVILRKLARVIYNREKNTID